MQKALSIDKAFCINKLLLFNVTVLILIII